ncbi:MAG: DnaA regulatory inactivator Hda [Gammaproteobacteria bacterium]
MTESITMQLPLGIRLKDSNTFANFVSGPNGEVLAYLQSQLRGGAAVYLWGAGGTGKTHLLQAACHEAGKAGLRTAYVPLTCWRELSVELLEGLEAVDLVCLDDVAAVAGQPAWEVALFHLYNRLRDAGGNLLASGPLPPASLPLALPDLRSRLAWGMVFQLQPLGDEEKLVGLCRRARDRGLELPEKVGRYLLQRCPRDMSTLFCLLDSLDRASLAAQRRLTIPFVKEVMDAQHR